jgi:murein DD-endopeptidase MepM/ murein hydrolase activator NlpD
VRVLAPLVAVAAIAGIVAQASTAKTTPAASARAAVVSGTLGVVAPVSVSGEGDASRSAPSTTPKGIGIGDGSASASGTLGGGDASATATAQAQAVDLLDHTVTADAVTRSVEATGAGAATYEGSVENLAIAGSVIGSVHSDKRYPLPNGVGYVQVNHRGAGLEVVLTAALGSYPAGTDVVVAKVKATARRGTPTATPTATATPTPTATLPTPTATPRPHKPKPPAYVKRLMSDMFVFPVLGRTVIGGPFGAARADTGVHEGNDLFANFGTPVVAVADGTVENVGSLVISGNRLWVYADTGDQFFYAHLSAFSPAAIDHAHVTAGTVLGYVGNTGDAEPTPPHLHFEIHPNGGAAVDPHPFLVAWQQRAVATGTDSATIERPGALVEVRDFIGDG